ncbi:MAG: UDP-2,3-diacylglucosamine diphosphatase [Thiohalocapsa sp.]
MKAKDALLQFATSRAPPDRGTSLFISDLHLAPERSRTIELFLRFLGDRAAGATRLFILGDLFDAWIGDDDDTPMHRSIIDGLRALTDGGTRCALMHGNRDFLIGRRFARASGCTLLQDPTRLELGGEPLLLMHGDLLCTDDLPYQRFRRRVRNPLVQRLFLWRPLVERRRIAADYRRKSSEAMASKTPDIMDVNPKEVVRRMHRARVQRLVHGHTHRRADHQLVLDNRPATRHVLAEWHEHRGEVLVDDQGCWHREIIE